MGRPKTRDPIKGVILESMLRLGLDAEDMATAVGVSRSTFYRMMKEHTDTWTIAQVRCALKLCGEELSVKVTAPQS